MSEQPMHVLDKTISQKNEKLNNLNFPLPVINNLRGKIGCFFQFWKFWKWKWNQKKMRFLSKYQTELADLSKVAREHARL